MAVDDYNIVIPNKCISAADNVNTMNDGIALVAEDNPPGLQAALIENLHQVSLQLEHVSIEFSVLAC
jgi:hypothetical protein